ncbi:hypothetical protein IAD21_01730 [Abditibacteriota bacterium]|nr:hypothetical protein IAD21_01730 [Abditibacteriota bacterium]
MTEFTQCGGVTKETGNANRTSNDEFLGGVGHNALRFPMFDSFQRCDRAEFGSVFCEVYT